MAKKLVSVSVEVPPPPAGFEYAGELRRVSYDEWYAFGGEAHRCVGEAGEYLILRRVEPKKESRWISAYAGLGYPSREACDANYADNRVAVVRFDLENDIPVSVTLEPT